MTHFDQQLNPAANYLFRNDPGLTLQALSQQKDSLKALTYVATSYYQHRSLIRPPHSPTDAGFAEFHSLESVTLCGQCPNFERAVMSSQSPSSLKTLVFQTDEIYWAPLGPTASVSALDAIPFLRAPSCSVPPALSTLRIVGREQDFTAAMKGRISSAAKEMLKLGVALEVQVESRSTYFPPFLYGEPLPKATTVFDGTWRLTEHRPRTLWNDWGDSSSEE